MYLDKVKRRAEELGVVPPNSSSGCTEDEIRGLESQFNVSLPSAYVEFLLWIGHGRVRLLQGTDCFYEDLPSIHEWAPELLKENEFPKRLPEDAFVFLMHQGYQFMFFRLSEGSDPPVYYYHESRHKKEFERRFEHFSDLLAAEVEGYA